MRKYNISAKLVRNIEQLYDKATSAVQMNVLENGSDKQSELGKDVFCHPHSSTFVSNGSCLKLLTNMMERLV